MGYLVVAIAVLVLAFGSIGLAYAKPNRNNVRNQAQAGVCPGQAQGAVERGRGAGICDGSGAGECGLVGQAGPRRGGNCDGPGAGECGPGKQAGARRGGNSGGPGAAECVGPCGL